MDIEQTRGRTDWFRVAVIFGAGVLTAFQIGKAPPSLPQLRADLGLTLVGAGWVISLFTLIGFFCGIFAGAVADRLGHRRLIITGLAVLCLGGVIGALAPNSFTLFSSRFIEGVGYLALGVSAPAYIYRFASVDRVRIVMGIWSCWIPAGTALMMFVSPFVLAAASWRILWLANALVLALYALLFSRWTGGHAGQPMPWIGSRVGFGRGVIRTVTSPGPVLLALCFGAFAFQYGGFMGFLPTLLIEDFGAGQSAASMLAALMLSMNAVGNLFSGWLLQKGVKRAVLLVAAHAATGLCSFGVYSSILPDPIRVLFGFLFSGISGMIPAALFAGAVVLAPNSSLVATTNGLMMQGANMGTTFGPPVVALVVTAAGGWHAAPWAMIGIAVLGVVFSLGLGVLEPHSETDRL